MVVFALLYCKRVDHGHLVLKVENSFESSCLHFKAVCVHDKCLNFYPTLLGFRLRSELPGFCGIF